MASRSSKRIFTVTGVGLWMVKLLETTDTDKTIVENFKTTALWVFSKQKDHLTTKEAKAIRQSVLSRFKIPGNLPFTYLKEELEDIHSMVKAEKKERIQDMLTALEALRPVIPESMKII